jgi:hypothetical protein
VPVNDYLKQHDHLWLVQWPKTGTQYWRCCLQESAAAAAACASDSTGACIDLYNCSLLHELLVLRADLNSVLDKAKAQDTAVVYRMQPDAVTIMYPKYLHVTIAEAGAADGDWLRWIEVTHPNKIGSDTAPNYCPDWIIICIILKGVGIAVPLNNKVIHE